MHEFMFGVGLRDQGGGAPYTANVSRRHHIALAHAH